MKSFGWKQDDSIGLLALFAFGALIEGELEIAFIIVPVIAFLFYIFGLFDK